MHLVRYADDFIITGNSQELLATKVKPIVESFLRDRGLELSPEKTSIVHLTEGFDFLGQNVRRYPNGKLLIKPSRKSIVSLLTRVKQIVEKHMGGTAHHLITCLNPVIWGWANYHRHVVSKRIFARINSEVFWTIWRWAVARHPRKGRRWIKDKYFERVGNRDWCFFGKSKTERKQFAHVRLFHASSIRIDRHVKVRSDVNPYDPTWAVYLAQRSDRRSTPTVPTRRAFAKA